MAKRLKFTIIYKSGCKVHLKAHTLKATWNVDTSAITELEWRDTKPDLHTPGIAHIESIWNGWV